MKQHIQTLFTWLRTRLLQLLHVADVCVLFVLRFCGHAAVGVIHAIERLLPARWQRSWKRRKYLIKKQYFRLRYTRAGSTIHRFMTKRYVKSALAAVAIFVFVGGVFFSALSPVMAATFSIDSTKLLNGRFEFNELNVDKTSIELQKGNLGSWENDDGLASSIFETYGDAQMVYGPNNVMYYTGVMNGNCNIHKYDVEYHVWSQVKTPPSGCGSGNQLLYDGSSKLYMFAGATTSTMMVYDIANDSWLKNDAMPVQVGSGASSTMVTISGEKYIYIMRGSGSATFWKYQISSGVWTQQASFPPTTDVNYGMSMTWDGADTIYAISDYRGEFKKFSISGNKWTNISTISANGYLRHRFVFFNGIIYDLRFQWNSNLGYLATYDPVANSWTSRQRPPIGGHDYDFVVPFVSDGSRYFYTYLGRGTTQHLYRYDSFNHTWDGGNRFEGLADDTNLFYYPIYDGNRSIYYFGGTSAINKVYKFDLATRQATQIDTHSANQAGTSGVYNNGALYVLPATGVLFQKYDIATKVWTQLADLPIAYGGGSDLIDGGDGYIYATFSGSSGFRRYSLATDTWSTALPNMPEAAGNGTKMARIGTTIYVIIANGSNKILKYSGGANGTWSIAARTPIGVNGTASYLVSDGSRYLYFTQTRSSITGRRMYRFDTTTQQTTRILDAPDSLWGGTAMVYNLADNNIFMNRGYYNVKYWIYNFTNDNYVKKGSWISESYDLGSVDSWQSLTYSMTGTGTVKTYVRTSAEGRLWSDWFETSGSTITAPKAKFAQVKVELSSDGTTTPKISNLKIDYNQDNIAPSLPAQLTVKASKDSPDTLDSGQTYPHQHPYINWQGADDGVGGSGVAGYYVYFGTDSNADPQLSGSYQNATDYVVNTAMTAGSIYYVRVKAVDKAGNVSPAGTFFSYRYWYISPPATYVRTSDVDFGQGTNNNVDISGGGMRLIKQPNGAWSKGPIEQLPGLISYGTSVVADDALYVLPGNGSTSFWRLNLITNVWTTNLATLPAGVTTGSSLVSDGGNYLYAIRGGNVGNAFYRYNIAANSWETLPTLPANAQAGTDMEYIGNGRIAILFTSTKEFYFYDVNTQLFDLRASFSIPISTYGTSLWFDGTNSIFVSVGFYDYAQVGRFTLHKYSINEDFWRPMSPMPRVPLYMQNNLVGDGRGNLYMFASDAYNYNQPSSRAIKYEIATETWSEVSGFHENALFGTVASDNNRYIYVLPSSVNGYTRKIIRYDTWTNTSSPDMLIPSPENYYVGYPQSSLPWTQGNATATVYDGQQYIYQIIADAGNTSRFVRYDPKTGETKYLLPPIYAGASGSMTYVNGKIYYQIAGGFAYFYEYDIVKEEWMQRADLPVASTTPGTNSLVGLSDGKVLAFVGNGTTTVYKFTPDGGMGGWTQMANAPGALRYSAVAYDSANNYVYVLAGNNGKKFYRYNVSNNTWGAANTLADTPVNAYYGGIFLKDNKIYTMVGNGTQGMYIYDIGGNTWTQGPDSPDPMTAGGSFIYLGNNQALYYAGDNYGDPWYYNLPTANTAYSAQATHISPVIDGAGIFDYAGIKAQLTAPAGTSVEFWTRTSNDGANWDDWKLADQEKKYTGQSVFRVNSTPRVKTQIKIVLLSNDNLFTPTVDSYALDYYYDIDPPNNPTALTAFSDNTKQTVIATNTWYNYPKINLDWPEPGDAGGATDGPLGSNVKGYYVYFGTDPTAIPKTAGAFVDTSEYTSNLQGPGIFYARIQAVDQTGNVDPDVYTGFIYKFDNEPPNAPSLITITPGGFTALNKYSVQWPASFDAHSGIKEYCWHTGATSGAFSSDTCQTGRSLSDLDLAYTQGTNVFYIRVLDNAGNYSSSYTTASYYYSTEAPGPVNALRAVPPVSPQNLFAFAWELPTLYSGDPTQLQYCYSINVFPSPLNTTCTSERFIPPFKAATQQGTNIIYIVTRDEAGTANWNSYATANFVANTVSPGIPLNVAIKDTSDRQADRWSITLTWDKPTFEGNGVASYIVERSLDNHTFATIGNTSTRAFVDLDVQMNVEYYYRVRAADNVDNRGGASGVVIMMPKGTYSDPPKIVVAPRVQAGFDQASVSWATNRASTSFVYYGTSPTNLAQSKGSLELATEHSVGISGLAPSTLYYYRVQSFDEEHSYNLSDATSQLYTFKTTETARIYAVSTDTITLNSAILNWRSSVPTSSTIEYGTTLNYGMSQSSDGQGFASNNMMRLTGLENGTTYHYRISAKTEFGSSLRSDDYTFTTIPRPAVSNVTFQPIEDASSISARVVWKTNVPTTSTVRYSGPGTQKETTTSELTTDHSVVISELAGSTDYSIIIEGRDQYGNLATSGQQTWRSTVDTRPPVIANFSASATALQSSGNDKAQIIVTWKTDEPATTQVSYTQKGSKAKPKTTALDAEPTTLHTVIISNLNLSDIYTIQPISRDMAGNSSYGTKSAVVTPDKETSVLDTVLNALQRVFWF